MLLGVGLKDECHLLMDKVCSVYDKVCMMERCLNCPGTKNLQKFLKDLMGDELDIALVTNNGTTPMEINCKPFLRTEITISRNLLFWTTNKKRIT